MPEPPNTEPSPVSSRNFPKPGPRLFLLALAMLSAVLLLFSASAPDFPPANASANSKPLLQRLQRPAVGAHRGGSWSIANNTLGRFEEAIADGVDILECDLQITSDGIPVIFHDAHLGALFGPGPLVEDCTLEQVKAKRLNLFYEIPTFEELLQLCQGRVVINAEFKTQKVVAPAIALINQYDAQEWVYFQTKNDPETYRLARDEDSTVALLFKPDDDTALDWALALDDPRLLVIEIGENMRRPEVLDRVHQAGKVASYNAWRLAATQEFFRANAPELWNQGIDIAITKRPASAVRQRERWKRRH